MCGKDTFGEGVHGLSFLVVADHSSPNESYIIFTPWDTQPISVSTNALYWKERNKS